MKFILSILFICFLSSAIAGVGYNSKHTFEAKLSNSSTIIIDAGIFVESDDDYDSFYDDRKAVKVYFRTTDNKVFCEGIDLCSSIAGNFNICPIYKEDFKAWISSHVYNCSDKNYRIKNLIYQKKIFTDIERIKID